MRIVVAVLVMMQIGACGFTPQQSRGDILVIGDSVLAWNRSSRQDVGSVIAVALDRDVVSRATLGARVQPRGLGAIGGLSIPDQLSAGPWNWVLMNGGANDLGFSCNCTRCDVEIDALISETATEGAIPDLIGRARETGAQVLWAGYYEAPDSRSFRACRPGLVEPERRIATYARATDGVFFVDTEDVIDPGISALLATDRTHPSAEGSALTGQFLATEIARQSQR